MTNLFTIPDDWKVFMALNNKRKKPKALFWTRSSYRHEWLCPHGVGHGNHVHGCDGCCSRDDCPIHTEPGGRLHPGTAHIKASEDFNSDLSVPRQDGPAPVASPSVGSIGADGCFLRPVERIYVAGPFSGDRDGNTMRATYAMIEVARLGHLPHCPHTHTGPLHGLFDYDWFMELDYSVIRHWATALLYLGPSPGADKELELARSLGLKIYYRLEDVPFTAQARKVL